MALTIQVPLDIRNATDANAAFEIVAGLTTPFALWTFDPTTAAIVRGVVKIPEGLAGSPSAKLKLFCMANAITGAARVIHSSKIVDQTNVAESFSVALTAGAAQNITVPGVARKNFVITFTDGDLTNVVTASGGKYLVFEIQRVSADGADTLAVDLEVVDAVLEITVL